MKTSPFIVSVDNDDNAKNLVKHEVHAFEQFRKFVDEQQQVASPMKLFDRVVKKWEPLRGHSLAGMPSPFTI